MALGVFLTSFARSWIALVVFRLVYALGASGMCDKSRYSCVSPALTEVFVSLQQLEQWSPQSLVTTHKTVRPSNVLEYLFCVLPLWW